MDMVNAEPSPQSNANKLTEPHPIPLTIRRRRRVKRGVHAGVKPLFLELSEKLDRPFLEQQRFAAGKGFTKNVVRIPGPS